MDMTALRHVVGTNRPRVRVVMEDREGTGILVLTQQPGGEIVLPGCNVSVTTLEIGGKAVRVGVTAPADIKILRRELVPAAILVSDHASADPLRSEKDLAAKRRPRGQNCVDEGMISSKKTLLVILTTILILGTLCLGSYDVTKARRMPLATKIQPESDSLEDSWSAEFAAAPKAPSSVSTSDGHLPWADQAVPIDRIPAEFEPQRAILISGQHLARNHPDVFANVVDATRGHLSVVTLVASIEEQEALGQILADRSVPASHVSYVGLPHDSPWIRDYGPVIARRKDGGYLMLDADYGERDRSNDNVVPSVLANCLRMPVSRPPIIIEGGNLLTNGDGLLVTSQKLIDQNAFEGKNEDSIVQVLRRHYGARQSVILTPLVGEPTGHVDVFATFCGPRTIIVGVYDSNVDSVNAAILDRNAERLANIMTRRGPLNVVRIPMPSNADGCWRSYTNVVYANGVLLMPSYPSADRNMEAAAIRVFQRLLPGWKVTGIDAEALCATGGSLHCITSGLGPIDSLPPCWNTNLFLDEGKILPHSFQWSDLCEYHRSALQRIYRSRRSFPKDTSKYPQRLSGQSRY